MGDFVTTPIVKKEFAKVNVNTKVNLPEGADPKQYAVKTSLRNPNGQMLVETMLPAERYHI